MASPNFGALLDKAPTEIERPKPAPQGTYTTVIQGMPKYDVSTKKKTEYVEFTHKFLEAGDDVDADDLKAFLTTGDGSKKKLSDVTMRNTYYLTEGSLWRLKDFLKDCGFDVGEDDTTFRQMIEETPGKQVGVFVKHQGSQDGTSVFANIDHTVAVE